MSSLQLRELQKYYGEHHALKPTNLDVGDGEFLVLLGPSGCGKSTMLRMIAGLEEISDGQILIDDRVVNDMAPRDRDVAMVFQDYALYPHRTVRQNLGFSLKLRKTEPGIIRQRVDDVAKLLGLTEVLERYPKQLSGGQRQRVAMGRAIVREPKLFLFDEPLSNLDAKLRVQMRGEIKELHARLGTTIIYVTHDQIEAMTMADRIVVLNTGVVAQVGEPMDVYKKPADMFVAGFIGSPPMNMFTGTAAGGEFACAGGKIAMPGLPQAGEAILGLRPEDILLASAEDGQAPATVRVVEPTGSEAIIVLDLLGQKTHILHRGDLPSTGQKLGVRVSSESAHLFQSGNGGARI